jgi:hypothetical protein
VRHDTASLDRLLSPALLIACAGSKESAVVQAFDDAAPSGAEITDYDHEHIMLYYCLLDRKERRRDWRETVQAFLDINVAREPERARRVYDSHLARATTLSELPYFANTFRLAPYLWG